MELSPEDVSLIRQLHEAEQEAMQEMTGLTGWTYKDLPRMTEGLMVEFKSIVGEGNLKWITYATYADGQSVSERGQVMISPDGIRRLRDYTKEG